MTTATVHASCLCGAVRWEIDGPPSFMTNCHCSRCRKAHGAAFGTYAGVPAERFRLTAGREQIIRYESSPGSFRPFCGVCGSVVPDGEPWNGRVAMPAGPFDDDPGMPVRAHIFVASKAPWHTLSDDLPKFDAYPPGADAPSFPTRENTDPPAKLARGSCLCGQVAYALDGPVLRVRLCHCGRCRKSTGSPWLPALVSAFDGVRYTRGETLLRTYKVPDAQHFKHVFCAVCGSSMPRHDAGRGIAVVPMGTLDDDPGVRPDAHIFVASKAPWDTISDDLPQHDAYPPA